MVAKAWLVRGANVDGVNLAPVGCRGLRLIGWHDIGVSAAVTELRAAA